MLYSLRNILDHLLFVLPLDNLSFLGQPRSLHSIGHDPAPALSSPPAAYMKFTLRKAIFLSTFTNFLKSDIVT